MLSRLNITAKGLILVLLPVGFQIVFALILTTMLMNSVASLEYLQHSLSAMSDMSRAYSKTLANLCTAVNRDEEISKKLAALDAIKKSTDWLDPEAKSRKRFPEFMHVEADWLNFHSALVQSLEKVRKVISAPGFDPHKQRDIIGMQETLPLFMEAQSLNDRLFGIERQMVSTQPQELEKFRQQFFSWLVAALLGSCLISIWLGKAFSTDFGLRLKEVEEQATKILVGDSLTKPREGSDEIANLERILYETNLALKETRRCELAVLENATHIFCATDRGLKLKHVVLDSNRTWGYDVDELRGRSILSLLTDENKHATNMAFATIADAGGTAQVENVVRCKSGALRTFSWTISWEPVEKLFYCVIRDVTELRSLEKLKQNFLAMVSNDLSVPLKTVGESLAVLVKGEIGALPEGVRTRIELALRNNERLTQLLDVLLKLEKMSAGNSNLQLVSVKTSKLCSSANDQLRDLAEKSSIEIITPQSDSEAYVDAGRITQVLVNLLSNAIKFSPNNSRIVFDIKEVGDIVEIGISDSGPGIPKEHLGLIFSRFHQVKSGTAKGIKGSGLGLAIVQSIVTEHGGSVGVESTVGEGSRFWIRIPARHTKETET